MLYLLGSTADKGLGVQNGVQLAQNGGKVGVSLDSGQQVVITALLFDNSCCLLGQNTDLLMAVLKEIEIYCVKHKSWFQKVRCFVFLFFTLQTYNRTQIPVCSLQPSPWPWWCSLWPWRAAHGGCVSRWLWGRPPDPLWCSAGCWGWCPPSGRTQEGRSSCKGTRGKMSKHEQVSTRSSTKWEPRYL